MHRRRAYSVARSMISDGTRILQKSLVADGVGLHDTKSNVEGWRSSGVKVVPRTRLPGGRPRYTHVNHSEPRPPQKMED